MFRVLSSTTRVQTISANRLLQLTSRRSNMTTAPRSYKPNPDLRSFYPPVEAYKTGTLKVKYNYIYTMFTRLVLLNRYRTSTRFIMRSLATPMASLLSFFMEVLIYIILKNICGAHICEGPGGGSVPYYRTYFDPKTYRVIQFDQVKFWYM